MWSSFQIQKYLPIKCLKVQQHHDDDDDDFDKLSDLYNQTVVVVVVECLDRVKKFCIIIIGR